MYSPRRMWGVRLGPVGVGVSVGDAVGVAAVGGVVTDAPHPISSAMVSKPTPHRAQGRDGRVAGPMAASSVPTTVFPSDASLVLPRPRGIALSLVVVKVSRCWIGVEALASRFVGRLGRPSRCPGQVRWPRALPTAVVIPPCARARRSIAPSE